jgi:DNA-binding CsgD family transcriptional regulator
VETAVQTMKSGAVDFIEKPFKDEALLDAINAALSLDRGPTRDRESLVAAKLMAKLSPRERQVLDGLVAGRSTKQMAYDLGISARTVEVHRARMLARLGTHSLAEAIRLAVLAGLPPVDLEAKATDRSGVPAPRAGCRNRRSILSRRMVERSYRPIRTSTISCPRAFENGRSVPAAILRELLGNNNGMRRGVISRRKNRCRFVRIPVAVVNVEIKPASFSRNLCLR